MAPPVVEFCLQRIRDVLSFDADFGHQCRTEADLCELLADGEYLCCIICALSGGKLSPDDDGSVTFYSENSQLLARRNVRFFLAKCSEHFGVDTAALFEPEDLLEQRRPDRVVACLRELLRSPQAQQRKSELDYAAVEEAGMAQNVIDEICQLERQLASKLELLLRFREELRGILSEWNADLLDVTFQHIEELLSVHQNLYAGLYPLAQEGPAKFCSWLGELFRRAKPELAIYAKYYSHYPLAKARLEEEFHANPQLKRQLQMLVDYFQAKSFNVLYDAPLRQMFNYSLLFDRLLTTAGRELPDTEHSVEVALDECKNLLKHFNECKRSSEKAAATQMLLQKIGRLPEQLAKLEETGLHWADGQFRVKKDQELAKDCFCMLTDRQLIVATKTSRGGGAATNMEFLLSVPIAESLDIDYNGGAIVLTLREQQQQQAAGATGGTQQLTFSKPILQGKKSSSVSNWGNFIRQVKAFNFPDGWNSGEHRFRLSSFPSGSACSWCYKEFTRYALQGYQCDHCGQQVDAGCLKIVVRVRQRPQTYPGPVDHSQLEDCEFFHRGMDRKAAERLLARSESGAFLIRESSSGKHKLVLSLRWQDSMFHVFIETREDGGSIGSPQYALENGGAWHASLNNLIVYYSINQLSIRGQSDIRLGAGIAAAGIYANY